VFVACSAGALTSIVGNLVQNALKFVTSEERREVRIRWAEVDRGVCIEVQDSGPGVAPELRDAVFEPFVRAGGAKPGVGLGLATVKKLCQGHGGSVGVRSAPGGGATFAVVLPCGEPPAARAGAPGDGDAPVRPAAPALH
jgi:signal transduction histidine kinase